MNRLEEIKLAIENAQVAGRLFIDMDLGDASYLISEVDRLREEQEKANWDFVAVEPDWGPQG